MALRNTKFSGIKWLIPVVLAATMPTMAATESVGAHYPPVEQATFHQLVFANDDVAILINRYPPGGNSDFHLHPRDLFFVTVTPSLTSAQRLGQPLSPPRQQPAGIVGYNVMGSEPFIHRVINNGDAPALFVAIEIRRAAPMAGALTERGGGYVQILDNSRLRAWRVVLEPGQSLPALTQRANGVRVVVRGGLLRTSRPGIADQVLALESGNVAWQQAGETRALSNAGTTPIELVEMELK
ncbi:MAG TPA: hypothetical protein VGN36_09360 [Sphingorhabdus sp.]|nr:hypothetical protein [Sphingorhabdus sp.]